ncbi:efflux transporter outer membrane subunit [Pseudomonas shirazensis]|uniref:efflux transporter outer membrane subunit n=1 Tax=Pseudomonas shirazensis TaxID=2745494 RepID=UPI003D2C9269
MTRIFVVTALATAIQACSLIPDYARPAAPTPSTWPTGLAYENGTVTPQPTLRRWDEFYKDQGLQRLIESALEHNRDLKVAALNVEAFRAQYRIQRADLLPTVGVQSSTTRQRLPGDLRSSGNAGIDSQYGMQVGITSYELDVFGRVRSLNEQALERYLSVADTSRSIQISLVSNVAIAYYTLQTDLRLQQLTDATLQSYVASLGMVEASNEAGTASALAVRQARTLVDGARAQLFAYTRQVAQDVNALQLLVGDALSGDSQSIAETFGQMPELPASLPSQVLQQRPDILAAEHQLKAANANIGAARAAFFPSISITAGAGTASSELDGLFKGRSGAWSFIPTINVPIFTGGQLKANLDYAKIQKDINVASYEKAIQTAFKEVADGLASTGTYRGQVKAQGELVTSNQEYVDMAKQRYEEGVDNYLTFLDAQRQLFESQQQFQLVRLAQLNSQVQLYKSLGGGLATDTQ